jgi:very-short-patch-repair endonuclease
MRNPIVQSRARSLRNYATDTERHLWSHLRGCQLGGHRFRRQVPIGDYIADFACLEAKLIVELDGGQHQEQADYDARRDAQIEAQGFQVLRFWDNQVFKEMQAVLEVILRALEERTSPHPNLPPQAGEGAVSDPQAGERANTQAGKWVEAPSPALRAREGWGGGEP